PIALPPSSLRASLELVPKREKRPAACLRDGGTLHAQLARDLFLRLLFPEETAHHALLLIGEAGDAAADRGVVLLADQRLFRIGASLGLSGQRKRERSRDLQHLRLERAGDGDAIRGVLP